MAESLRGLQTVLLLDQHERWQQGDRPRVEVYLQTIPELGSDRRHLLDVIYQEVLLREEVGERPTIEEYVKRFPMLEEELRLQFEVHAGLPCIKRNLTEAHWPAPFGIAGYRIDEELGRGTFGVVYRAWEEKLMRHVAIKLLRPVDEGDEPQGELTLREAQSIARLVHPHIVQIYAVGETDQGLYFSQEYVANGTLAKLIGGAAQLPRSAAAFVSTLSDAIHYAHLCQVIHCDLKPANILVKRQSPTTPRSGDLLHDVEPKVSDFGLSLHVDSDSLSPANRLRGTMHYMAPEQTCGDATAIGPAVDVYALGAILYELLTGKPPYANDSKLQVYLKSRQTLPPDPRELNAAVPRDLSAICLKCLSKSPADRYATAAALAEDLRQYLSGHVPKAVDARHVERLVRWGRRNPAVAGLLAALVLATIAGFAGITAKMLEAQRAETSERQRADELDASLYRNKFQLARRAWEANDLVPARRNLEQTAPARRSFEWHYLYKLCTDAIRRLPWDGEYVTSIAYSPGGSRLAIGDGRMAVEIVSVSTGEVLHRFAGHEEHLATPSLSADGMLLAAVGIEKKNSWIRVWNADGGQEIRRIGSLLGTARAVAFSADGKRLTTVSVLELFTKSENSLEIEVWETATGKRLSRVTAKVSLDRLHFQVERYRAVVSPDGRTIALWISPDPVVAPLLPLPDGAPAIPGGHVSPLDHKILLVDAQTGNTLEPLIGHASFINDCAFSPDSTRLASAGIDGKALLWDARTGELVKTFPNEGESIHTATFSSDGKLLATGGNDSAITLWDVETGHPIRKLGGYDSPVKFVAIAPDSQSVASADLRSEIQIWNLNTLPAMRIREDSNVDDLAWMKDGKSLVYDTFDGKLLVCDAADPQKSPREISNANRAFLSDDRSRLAAVDPAGGLLLSGEGRPLSPEPIANTPRVSNSCATPIAFSPDGSLLACIEPGGKRAFILDSSAQRVLAYSPTAKAELTSVAFRHDGKLLAMGSEDGWIFFCDPATGAIVDQAAAQFPVRNVAFRPGSDDLAAIGSVDRFVEIWNSTTGESRLVIPGYRSQADDHVYTSDGKRLITAGPGKTVTVWDADSGDELLVLDDVHGLPRDLAVSVDNRQLAASVGLLPNAGKIVIWDGQHDEQPESHTGHKRTSSASEP